MKNTIEPIIKDTLIQNVLLFQIYSELFPLFKFTVSTMLSNINQCFFLCLLKTVVWEHTQSCHIYFERQFLIIGLWESYTYNIITFIWYFGTFFMQLIIYYFLFLLFKRMRLNHILFQTLHSDMKLF